MKNKNNFLGFFEARSRTTEAVAGVAALAVLAYLLRLFLAGKTTLVHDNLAWNYPVFQFFAENIINGHFPFWNPFSHGGEPFYPLLGQLRLFEPTALLTIYIGHFFTNDIVILFNWNRVVQTLIMSFGAYVCLRPFAINLFVRLTLIPILVFSSFFLGSFRQDAILNQFMWVPFIAHLFLRIAYYKDYRWHNYLFAVVLIGLNYQSYFFSGVLVFILFFTVALAIFRLDLLKGVFKSRQFFLKFVAAFFIISMMAAPNIVLMLEKNDYIFPARMLDPAGETDGPLQHEGGPELKRVAGINMPYHFIKHTGTFSTVSDFIQMISPDGNEHIRWPDMKGWGRSSEAYIYLGLLVWCVGILGLLAGEHELKRVWALLLLLFGLLMLGPPGGLHWLLYHVYPPMWFVRHTHAFVLFFVFSFLYFYVLGLNRIFSSWGKGVFNLACDGNLTDFIRGNKILVAVMASAFVLAAISFKLFFFSQLVMLAHFVWDYLFIFILLALACCWFFQKKFGKKFIFILFVVSNSSVVLVFSANMTAFLEKGLFFLVLPVAVYLFFSGKRAAMKYSLVIVAAMFSLCLSTDLINSFIKTSFFYNDSRHPGVILNINTTPQRPQFSDTRASFVVSPEYLPYQSARYLSILYRLPVAVSSVKENLPYELYKNMPRHVFFDSQQAHSFLPLPYNVNSSVVSQEVIEKDNELLLKVFPLSKGDSYVGFKTTEIESIRGAYVWFSVWIKSVAKARGSVQISIQDRDTGVNRSDDAFKANFYGSTGGWERVTVGKYIGNDSRYLSVKGVVTEKGMEAYFKNPIIEITPREDIKRDFEFALINKRWSSFLLQASYFNLVNSGIPPRVMEKIFAINGPLIQFKKDVIQLDDGLIPDYLKKLGDDSAIKLLAEKAFVDSVPLNNAGKTFADSGPEFSYSVRRYDYDFIELKVSSPSNGFLYWADGYNKNWHAYVNGAEMPVARANMNFKIIRLPKGESEVRFVYKADRFKYGLGLFYGALFAGVSVGLITYATGRKEN